MGQSQLVLSDLVCVTRRWSGNLHIRNVSPQFFVFEASPADIFVCSGSTMDELGFYVSSNLHHRAIRNIFYATMSYFDTTVS